LNSRAKPRMVVSTPLRGTMRPSWRMTRSSGGMLRAKRARGLLMGDSSVGSKPQGMMVIRAGSAL